MVKRRKLESLVAKDDIRYDWKNFFDLTVVIVESNRPLSVSRVANSFSPEGQNPDLMVLVNPLEKIYTIKSNRIKANELSALKLLGGLTHELNLSDETAVCGGTKWVLNKETGTIYSPNHGFKSSLSLKEVIIVIGMKQYFREIKKLRNTIFLPSPGQVDATESIRMALEKTPGEMPIGGKIEVIKGKAKITLRGSL
ncbi:MAG: hypothetical protein Q8N37_04130 [bacterium]|nr:hypothetical protein [bacterium]